ncbi:hypothetical protein, partial [Serratia sp. OS31]|uniref:hypothetical protein n=1 Tax=Serratia sp. OS31 TaxID=2760844 RepID=UPI001C71BB78
KRRSADGSVGSPHARVGHCQASIKPRGHPQGWPFCYVRYKYLLLFRPIFTPVFNAHHKNHAIFFARYLF